MNLKPYALLVLAASAIGAQPKTDKFDAVFRHLHYFLVWNAEATAPAIKLECVGYYRYIASLQATRCNPRTCLAPSSTSCMPTP